MGLATNKRCPSQDASVSKLKHHYTLRDIMKLEEYITVVESMEHASHLDNEARQDRGA